MFKRNSNYIERDITRDTEIVGKDVVLYPENQLEPILVKSDFGDCLVMTSDLYDLFNQQRIANFGVDVVRDFIARNYPLSSSVSEQISKMSDDEIMNSIKPRNIQSYSELMLWSKYLQRQIDNAVSVTDSDSPDSENTEDPHSSSDDVPQSSSDNNGNSD